MRRHLPRLIARFLRAVSEHSATLVAVPDPHGQFPGLPISWYVRPTIDPEITIPEQPAGPPPGHPDHTDPGRRRP